MPTEKHKLGPFSSITNISESFNFLSPFAEFKRGFALNLLTYGYWVKGGTPALLHSTDVM